MSDVSAPTERARFEATGTGLNTCQQVLYRHRPFTAAHNATGRMQPEKLLAAFAEGGAADNEICLELSFREREPDDPNVIPAVAESVAFWAPHINTGAGDLK